MAEIDTNWSLVQARIISVGFKPRTIVAPGSKPFNHQISPTNTEDTDNPQGAVRFCLWLYPEEPASRIDFHYTPASGICAGMSAFVLFYDFAAVASISMSQSGDANDATRNSVEPVRRSPVILTRILRTGSKSSVRT